MRAAHYKRVDIQVLGVWKHRGNVELYFKHRYQDFNYRIGSLTEYFQFTDAEAVWDDLRQMPPKVLAPVELDVLEDNFISSLGRHWVVNAMIGTLYCIVANQTRHI